jgi:hypothetical protein
MIEGDGEGKTLWTLEKLFRLSLCLVQLLVGKAEAASVCSLSQDQ